MSGKFVCKFKAYCKRKKTKWITVRTEMYQVQKSSVPARSTRKTSVISCYAFFMHIFVIVLMLPNKFTCCCCYNRFRYPLFIELLRVCGSKDVFKKN